MNNVMNTTNQTPIEITLGIDENGVTTARKLYGFLEMDKSYYSRWYRQNVIDNIFAAESENYLPFTINGEHGGQASKDAELTADPAKKLSMTAKNEKGEETRNYFVTIENKSKKAIIQLSGLSTRMQTILMQDRRLVEWDKRIIVLEGNTLIGTRRHRKIRNAIHSSVASACDGIKTVAYKENSKRVYKVIYNFLHDHYNISEYADIPKVKYNEALSLIENWYPNYDLQLDTGISDNCRQQKMDLDPNN